MLGVGAFEFAAQGWFAFAGGLVGIVSLIVTIYAIVCNTERKFLAYEVFLIKNIGIDHFFERELYKHHPVVHSLLIIRNEGNRPLEKDDFVGTVSFYGNKLEKGGKFIAVEGVTSNCDNNNLSVKVDHERESINFDFDFLREGEYIVAIIIHSYLSCCTHFNCSNKQSKFCRRSRSFYYVPFVNLLPSEVFIASFIYCFDDLSRLFFHHTEAAYITIGCLILFAVFHTTCSSAT